MNGKLGRLSKIDFIKNWFYQFASAGDELNPKLLTLHRKVGFTKKSPIKNNSNWKVKNKILNIKIREIDSGL